MLEELEIHNLGPIRSALIAPAGGMTAITGETGAGKSMLLECDSADFRWSFRRWPCIGRSAQRSVGAGRVRGRLVAGGGCRGAGSGLRTGGWRAVPVSQGAGFRAFPQHAVWS